jgi:hypothetical protein
MIQQTRNTHALLLATRKHIAPVALHIPTVALENMRQTDTLQSKPKHG